LKNAGSL
jgi:hypothetical protein